MAYKLEHKSSTYVDILNRTFEKWSNSPPDIFLMSLEGHKIYTQRIILRFYSPWISDILDSTTEEEAGVSLPAVSSTIVSLMKVLTTGLVINTVKTHLIKLATSISEKQSSSLVRNFDNASKDYQEHLTELDKKITQVVDAALSQQLGNWERKPPVPSESFKAIGKQLSKFHEAVQDILPGEKVSKLFLTIHTQFLQRVRAKLLEVGLKPDNSPSHGLVMSELIFYRENLKYINVLPEDTLKDAALSVIWT